MALVVINVRKTARSANIHVRSPPEPSEVHKLFFEVAMGRRTERAEIGCPATKGGKSSFDAGQWGWGIPHLQFI